MYVLVRLSSCCSVNRRHEISKKPENQFIMSTLLKQPVNPILLTAGDLLILRLNWLGVMKVK